MGFQSAVATWFAVHLAADRSIGTQFGLDGDRRIGRLQCETGDPVDDIVVALVGGGAIYVQCKTGLTLSRGTESPFAKTLSQLVGLFVQHKTRSADSTPIVAVLAVAQDASGSLDDLEAACRLFDHGGAWNDVIAQVAGKKREALARFEAHVRKSWTSHSTLPPGVNDLASLAKMFRVRRFPRDSSTAEWQELARVLGRSLFGGEQAGEAPMRTLLGVCHKLIETGAPANRDGLLRGLRAAGHVDVTAPGYEQDLAALVRYSNNERRRLKKHTRLPLGDGIPIHRACVDPLVIAMEGGSLLVTGEPGAGKTGVLLALAERFTEGGGPAVFLSVERFSGFRHSGDFKSELSLAHHPIDVLAAWPGEEHGVLLIDALDASRGGPSESVIAEFIADAVERLGARWSIVASIRSFDLRNGRRFREIMRGVPPDNQFIEQGMDNVRHFRVPRLSPEELADVARQSPQLGALIQGAPGGLTELLRNIFNLSLGAELLSAGVDAESIRKLEVIS